MGNAEYVLIVTTVAGLLATIINIVNTNYREKKLREWQIEDRKLTINEIVAKAEAEATAVRIRAELTAKNLVRETKRAAAQVRQDNRVNIEAVSHKVESVGKQAEAAFNEANHVKKDIKNLNERLIGAEGQQGQLDVIVGKAESIEGKVDAITEAIIHEDSGAE